jgi:hypothetical protein
MILRMILRVDLILAEDPPDFDIGGRSAGFT